MANSNVVVNLTISDVDLLTNAPALAIRQIVGATFPASQVLYDGYVTTPGASQLTLVSAKICGVVFLRHAGNADALLIILTPTGGSAAVYQVAPQGFLLYFTPTVVAPPGSSANTNSITTVVIQSLQTTIFPTEVFIAQA